MNWFSEYKSSLKNLHAEEFLDVYFYRPFAFIIVKCLYRLPLTPNNYSFLSLSSGLVAAYCFSQAQFMYGAIAFFFLSVFDCCDGMQARMKKNGTEFGRFVDGIVDYFANIACYIGLVIGVNKAIPYIGSVPTWTLVVAAGISKAIHAILYDHYLMEYMSYDKGDGGFVQREINEIREKIKAAKADPNGSKLRLCILKIYLGFSSMQAGTEGTTLKFNSADYIEKNYRSIQLWGFIGPAWHITFLIFALLVGRPEILFIYSIIFGNFWVLVMMIYQNKIMRELQEKRVTA